ncbi:MAG TPA: hypothetical protein VIM03_07880, partial [Thermoleophilaceae bacterium]
MTVLTGEPGATSGARGAEEALLVATVGARRSCFKALSVRVGREVLNATARAAASNAANPSVMYRRRRRGCEPPEILLAAELGVIVEASVGAECNADRIPDSGGELVSDANDAREMRC